MRYFKRLSFARQTIYKSFMAGADCAECGHKVRDHGQEGAWTFVVSDDGDNTDAWDTSTFCSWDCRCTFYGIDKRGIA